MELLVAVAVLAAVAAMALPAARRVDGVRHESDRRRRAIAELSNHLTDLSRLPPARLLNKGLLTDGLLTDGLLTDGLLTDGRGGPLPGDLVAVRAAFAASLPGAELRVESVPLDPISLGGSAAVAAVRLDGALTWTTDAGAPARPVRLSAWAFAPETSE